MQTGKVIAVFDCKQYNAKLPKEQWRVVSDDENVQCTVTYDSHEVPGIFFTNGLLDDFCKPYISRAEKTEALENARTAEYDRVAVRFKVGANCKWFDKFGHACERPHNAELDGKRFEVNIDFTRKAKQPGNNLAPCGYWVNAIMYREIEENPFAGQAFESDGNDESESEHEYVQHFDDDTAPAAPAAPAEQAAPANDEEDGELPF